MAELAFDESAHRYTLGGREVPSVTQVLGLLMDFGGVAAEVLARAAEFGSHVHEAIDLDNKGDLDEAGLDAALLPYVATWRRLLADMGATVVESELRLADARMGYAGTLDAVLEVRGRRVLVDIKTGVVPRTVGPQLAAYEHLLVANGHPKPLRRLCAQLLGDEYRLHDCKDPADWSVFLSALNCWRFIHVR